jgi:hypothetical protein
MRTPLWAVAMACCVGAAVCAVPPAAAADAPAIESFPSGGATPRHTQQMKDWLTYWVAALRDAKTDVDAVKARNEMVAKYGQMDALEAGYAFVEQASAVAAPVLAKGFASDPLARVKEINLASAMSQMPQAPAQPALDVMVASADPAVRYLGWKGYRAVRQKIFALGLEKPQKALAAVEKASKTETSAPVLEQVFRMLDMDTGSAEGVAKEEMDKAEPRLLACLKNNWSAWCARVLDGDEEMAQACRAAAAAAKSHAPWVGQGKDKTNLLQLLVDLASCAAQSFVQAKLNGQSGDTFANLMLDCEAGLNGIAKSAKEFLKKPLSDPKISASPDNVRFFVDPISKENYGVQAWVDFLKDQNVTAPTYKRATASSAPARGAAPAPATAPVR